MSRLLRLYPSAWRDRHGEELLALLETRPPNLRDRIDLVRGALDARLHPELLPGPDGTFTARPDVAIRRLGVATMAGSITWALTWWIATTGPMVTDQHGTYRDGSAALLPWFVSMWLLVIGVAVHGGRLPAEARLARVGVVAAVSGLVVWSFGPWAWPGMAIGIPGLAVFGIGAWRSGAWPTLPSALLIGAAILVAVAILVALAGALATVETVLALGTIAIASVAWLVVGAMHLGAVRPGAPSPGGSIPA